MDLVERMALSRVHPSARPLVERLTVVLEEYEQHLACAHTEHQKAPEPELPRDERSSLVDEAEARRILGGLCAKTMYNLRQSGDLRGVKIGSRTMYDPADLRAFIDRQKQAVAQ